MRRLTFADEFSGSLVSLTSKLQSRVHTHEKELLAIIRALKKWRSDLMGSVFEVYTDHRTLENFDTQKDLSRRQLRWQEFLSQYECSFVYIKGEDNTVADGLSRVPPNAFPEEILEGGKPQDSSRSPPVLTAGLITPANVRDWELSCDGFFDRRKVAADDQVSTVKCRESSR